MSDAIEARKALLRQQLAEACDQFAEAGADRVLQQQALELAEMHAGQLATALLVEVPDEVHFEAWMACRRRLVDGALATALD